MSERAMRLALFLALFMAFQLSRACELCAIYNASNALGQSGSGVSFAVSEQFIPFTVEQFEGRPVTLETPSYVYSSITHLVPGYNFSSRLGVSLNLPLTDLDFRRTDLRYSLSEPPVLFTERGRQFGIGDLALIGRVTLFQKSQMRYGITVNLLAGLTFPTGDARRLQDEVMQTRIFESLLPPGTPHDPLAHSITSVHQHMLSLGSGSYDGVFGFTENARWRRWFVNGQFQYYLRTEGEATFQYGDELILSGGPGLFLAVTDGWTLSLQANGVYDTMARDRLLGRASDLTGQTGWFLGPLVNFTWGDRLNLTASIDVPLRIANNGFQSVPAYRINAGMSLRF